MDDFFPSEIARLILGYLNEEKCKQSWQTFLEESPDLREYFQLFKRGKMYSTKVNGKSLSDILAEYCVLKREALMKGICQEECSKQLNNQRGITEDAVEKIIKNALDVAFRKYLPSMQKCTARDSDDSVEFIRSEARINSLIEEHSSDENRDGSENNRISQLNDLNHNDDPTLEPNITHVTSVTNSDYNSIESSANGVPSSSLLALQSMARILSERSVDFNISTKVLPEFSSRTKSPQSLRTKSSDLPTIIKLEEDDDIEIINHRAVQSNDRVNVGNVIAQSKDSKLRDSSLIVGESQSQTTSSESDKALRSITENTAVSVKDVNSELSNAINSKSNCKVLNYSENNALQHCNSSQNNNSNLNLLSSNSSTTTLPQESPLDTQSSNVNTLNSANNMAGLSVTTNSISNQASAISDLSVPTYILSSISSNGQILQSTSPYQFVINTPVNGMSLAVPVNNVSNSVYTNSSKGDETACFVAMSSSSTVVAPTNVVTSGKDLYISYEKGEDSLKRKNKNEILPERKKLNSSEMSYTKTRNSNESEDSPKSKVLPDKRKSNTSEDVPKKTMSSCKNNKVTLNKSSSNKSNSDNVLVKKVKRHRCKRSKLTSLYQSPKLPTGKGEISTEENDIDTSTPDTDCGAVDDTPKSDIAFYLNKLMH